MDKDNADRNLIDLFSKDQRLFFQKLIDTIPDLIFVKDLDTRLICVNRSFCEISGNTFEHCIGKTAHDLYPKEIADVYYQKDKELLKSEQVNQNIEWHEDPTGNRILLDTIKLPWKNSDGKLMGIIGVSRDITEKKKLEDQLLQSQKMEAIGILTGGIAHEFNNLLVPILGYTEMLIRDKPKDSPDRIRLEKIQTAGNRAKKLTQQMLAYGQQSLSPRGPVKLEMLVDETIELLENTISTNISIKKEIEARLPPVLGMPNELHQVILNLLINASHAMPDGGELTVHLKKVDSHIFTISHRRKQEGDFIALSIQDTGCGMDQVILGRIFDPFFTTKETGEGSGLGLSVVHGIVEQHRGHIEVESMVGEGTTFHVYFPISKEKVEAPTLSKIKPLYRGNERILLIDDESMIISLTKNMLEELGYAVTEFADCTEALKWFTEHPQEFDLVLTDYGMPKINGKQLAEQIKEIRPDIPIIMFTGYGNLVAKKDITEWGLDGLLIKPFELQKLSETIRSGLTKRRTE